MISALQQPQLNRSAVEEIEFDSALLVVDLVRSTADNVIGNSCFPQCENVDATHSL